MKCPKLKTYTVTIQIPVEVQAVNEEHALLEAHTALNSLNTNPYKEIPFTEPNKWELNVDHRAP